MLVFQIGKQVWRKFVKTLQVKGNSDTQEDEEHERIELVEQKLPNFFDSLQEPDIKEYLEDYEDFREYGHVQFDEKQISQLEIELGERERGLNLRITDPTTQKVGSITAKAAMTVFLKQN